MKKLIRQFTELHDIDGMARIGFVPVNTKKTVEVYVHTDDEGRVPHFHVRKYGRNNQFDWEACVMYTSAEYFAHGHYTDRIPTKGCKQLDAMLRETSKSGRTYWETAVDAWNLNNSEEDLPYDLEQPDYTKLNQ